VWIVARQQGAKIVEVLDDERVPGRSRQAARGEKVKRIASRIIMSSFNQKTEEFSKRF
jgi:hypothetical protein